MRWRLCSSSKRLPLRQANPASAWCIGRHLSAKDPDLFLFYETYQGPGGESTPTARAPHLAAFASAVSGGADRGAVEVRNLSLAHRLTRPRAVGNRDSAIARR